MTRLFMLGAAFCLGLAGAACSTTEERVGGAAVGAVGGAAIAGPVGAAAGGATGAIYGPSASRAARRATR